MHMLRYGEPHPDVLRAGQAKHADLVPSKYPQDLQNRLMAPYQLLSPMQRAVIKVCVGFKWTEEELVATALLRGRGRLVLDHNPTAFFLCVGRRSGKTTILEAINVILTGLILEHGGTFQPNFYGTTFGRTSYHPPSTTPIVLMDEIFRMPPERLQPVITNQNSRMFVGTFTSLHDTRLVLPATLRKVVFSVDTLDAIPGFAMPDGASPEEFFMPPISSFMTVS